MLDLPSQTGMLFVLLILAIFAATVLDPLNPTTESSVALLVRQAVDGTTLPDLRWGVVDPASVWRWSLAVLGLTLKILLFPLVTTLAGLLLLVKPRYLRRRYQMQELASIHPHLAARFEGLALEMGIATPLELVWSPKRSCEAFVFGTFGKPNVCVTEGMIDHFGSRTAALEAVMAHELGHVANRDVTRTEMGEALVKAYFWLWLCILAVQATGFATAAGFQGQQNLASDQSFLASFLFVAIAYLSLNALCRVRQIHADARVVGLGMGEALAEATLSLTMGRAVVQASRFWAARSLAFGSAAALRAGNSLLYRSLRLVGPEPDFWTRRAAILDPAELLQPRMAVSFATGFIVYRLCLTLPVEGYLQAAGAVALIFASIGLTLLPHIERKSLDTGRAHATRTMVPQALAGALGIFVAGMLVLFTRRLANSMALLPVSAIERWQRLSGEEPLSLSVVATDASQQALTALWCMSALLALLVLLAALRVKPGCPSLSRWKRRAAPWVDMARLVGVGIGTVAAAVLYASTTAAMLGGAFQEGIAWAYGDRSDLEQAVVAARRAVELNPKSAQAWFNLGVYQHRTGEWEGASASDSTAIALDPRYAAAYLNRGYAHSDLGDHEKAISDYTRAIALKPKYAEAYNNRGTAYHDLGDHEKAIADYNRAIALDPSYAGAYNNRGTAYRESGDYGNAIADYTQAIALNPGNADAYYNRGNAYQRMGDHGRAISDYTRAIALKPKDAEAYNNRGIAYHELGDYQKAIADYNRAIALDPSYAGAYNNRGTAYRESGDYENAMMADYTQAIALNPGNATVYSTRGIAYWFQGDYRNAIADYNRAIALDPKNAKAYMYRGIAYRELGDYENAIADCSQAIFLNPEDAAAYSMRGSVYIALEDYRTAIADYTRAIALDPKEATDYSIRAHLYSTLGDYEKAIADYSEVIALNPRDAEAYNNRADAYSYLGEHQRAIADYYQAIVLTWK